ncbi:3'(2'),5'-bisphosphate nucleotidase CysQ [Tropicimonas sp.]|uniref:3'(2'),5'-bisphosphate nucleotidase CysQ n=1 Tax=Tropicimonas sp. TaxID=2067044 RepID=UPI003A861A25
MPANDLPLLTEAAHAAGRIALRHFRAGFSVWEKDGDQGPVTEADLEIDAMLRDMLIAARPDNGWMSEESPDDPDRRHRSRVFVVDPIDGTRAFADGTPTWAHSLAVIERGAPVAAAVFLPARDKLYTAARGAGARLNGAPVSASGRRQLDGADILANHHALNPKNWHGGAPAVVRHFRPSLAYRLSLVAEGRFDAMLTLRDTWEWDIAAGALIATEAGARVGDRFGKPIGFNSPGRTSAGILCAAPGIHDEIVNRLRT